MKRITVVPGMAKSKYRRNPYWYISLVCFLFVLTVLLSACSSSELEREDVIRGDVIEIEQAIDFFFQTGPSAYKEVPADEVRSVILENLTWSLSDGLDLVGQGKVDIESRYVAWEEPSGEDDVTYSVMGLGLVISAKIRVAANSQTEDKIVAIHLPGLSTVADSLEATAVFPNAGNFISPDEVQIQIIRVHSSTMGKVVNIVGRWLISKIGWIITIIIAIVLVWAQVD